MFGFKKEDDKEKNVLEQDFPPNEGHISEGSEQVSSENSEVLKIFFQQIQADARADLYVILDCAASNLILSALHQFTPEYMSLFKGTEMEPMVDVCPYLVKLDTDSQLLTWIFDNALNYSIFLLSFADLQKISDHFQKFIYAQYENEQQLFFRFYDPNILSFYLPSCTPTESEIFWGPVQKFMVGHNRQTIDVYFNQKEKLELSQFTYSEDRWDDHKQDFIYKDIDQDLSEHDFWVVRKEQIEVFSKQQLGLFEQELIQRGQEFYSWQKISYSQEKLEKIASQAIQMADKHGIKEQEDIIYLFDFMLEFGPNFGKFEKTAEYKILKNSDLDGHCKILEIKNILAHKMNKKLSFTSSMHHTLRENAQNKKYIVIDD